ncbi:hypothetical protein R1sor_012605 [Riccia sorocarpa]|uniref:Uncharacterized protein n=1 Tax=Riccia sorocarpa TaxID=122646 RepID=A0ABD3I655_9MARC
MSFLIIKNGITRNDWWRDPTLGETDSLEVTLGNSTGSVIFGSSSSSCRLSQGTADHAFEFVGGAVARSGLRRCPAYVHACNRIVGAVEFVLLIVPSRPNASELENRLSKLPLLEDLESFAASQVGSNNLD